MVGITGCITWKLHQRLELTGTMLQVLKLDEISDITN